MIERLRALVGSDAVMLAPLPPGDAVSRTILAVPGEAAALPVVAPGTAEEAAAVLRLASEEGWRVRIAGARSGVAPLAGEVTDTSTSPEPASHIMLTTERLVGFTGYEPADLVVSAGAGTTLGALNARLASERQWLPLDPAGGARTSLGAIVATAAAGPLRLGYGTPRDYVLGLQLVTGDGRVIECGGRVVKNVAGYDLVKLVVGSRGTLGLATRVDLRLRALPERDLTLLIEADSPAALRDAADAIRAAGIEPVALEFLSPTATGLVLGEGMRRWVAVVRLQGNGEAVAAAEEVVVRVGGRPAPDNVWAALDRVEGSAGEVLRLAGRSSSLTTTLDTAMELARRAAPGLRSSELPIMAHAGDGIVRVLLPAGPEQPPVAQPSPSVVRLMRGIRERFDPAGILVGGNAWL